MANLASRTLESLSDWINPHSCGVWSSTLHKPVWMVSEEAVRLSKITITQDHFGGHWKTIRYASGRPYYPGDAKKSLGPVMLGRMIRGQMVYYYSSGRHGWALMKMDVDAHHGETDAQKMVDELNNIFGAGTVQVRPSKRGFNVFLKWEYKAKEHGATFSPEDWRKANVVFDRLQAALKKYFRSYDSQIEVKGKITIEHSQGNFGSLAKMPCFGVWNEQTLQEFDNLPVVDTDFVNGIIHHLQVSSTPEGVCGATGPKRPVRSSPSSGSCDAFTISEEDMESVENYLHEARTHSWHLFNMRQQPKRYGVTLTTSDFRIFLVVLGFARKYRLAKFGEQMASAYLKNIWNHLYDSGKVDRAYDSSRVAAMRNTMADCGYLHLVSNAYYFDVSGKTKGKAMEWHLKDRFDVVQRCERERERERESIMEEALPAITLNSWRPILTFAPTTIQTLVSRFLRQYSPPQDAENELQMAA